MAKIKRPRVIYDKNRLIALVKERELLYNKEKCGVELKNSLWMEVADGLNEPSKLVTSSYFVCRILSILFFFLDFSVKFCKDKWRNIRDVYFASIRDSPTEACTSHNLSFLFPFMPKPLKIAKKIDAVFESSEFEMISSKDESEITQSHHNVLSPDLLIEYVNETSNEVEEISPNEEELLLNPSIGIDVDRELDSIGKIVKGFPPIEQAKAMRDVAQLINNIRIELLSKNDQSVRVASPVAAADANLKNQCSEIEQEIDASDNFDYPNVLISDAMLNELSPDQYLV